MNYCVVSTIDTNGGFETFRYENCLEKRYAYKRTDTDNNR